MPLGLSLQEKNSKINKEAQKALDSLQGPLVSGPSPSQIISQALESAFNHKHDFEDGELTQEHKQQRGISKRLAANKGEDGSDNERGPTTEASRKLEGPVESVRRRRASMPSSMYHARLPPAALLMLHKDMAKHDNNEGQYGEMRSQAMNWVGNRDGVNRPKHVDPLLADEPEDDDVIPVAPDTHMDDLAQDLVLLASSELSHTVPQAGGITTTLGRAASHRISIASNNAASSPPNVGHGRRRSNVSGNLTPNSVSRRASCVSLGSPSARPSVLSTGSATRQLMMMADCAAGESSDEEYEMPAYGSPLLSGADQALNLLRGSIQGRGNNQPTFCAPASPTPTFGRRSVEMPGALLSPTPTFGRRSMEMPGAPLSPTPTFGLMRPSVGPLSGMTTLGRISQANSSANNSPREVPNSPVRSRTTNFPLINSPTGTLSRGASVRFDAVKRGASTGELQLQPSPPQSPKGSRDSFEGLGSHAGRVRRHASRLSTTTGLSKDQDEEDILDELSGLVSLTTGPGEMELMTSWLLTASSKGATLGPTAPHAPPIRSKSNVASQSRTALSGHSRAPRASGSSSMLLPVLNSSGSNRISGQQITEFLLDDPCTEGEFLLMPSPTAGKIMSGWASNPDPRSPAPGQCLALPHPRAVSGSLSRGMYPPRAASTQPMVGSVPNNANTYGRLVPWAPAPDSPGSQASKAPDSPPYSKAAGGDRGYVGTFPDPHERSASCMPMLHASGVAGARGAPSPVPPKHSNALQKRLNKYSRPHMAPTPDALFSGEGGDRVDADEEEK